MTRRGDQERYQLGKRRWSFGGEGHDVGVVAFLIVGVSIWWRARHRGWIIGVKDIVWWWGSFFERLLCSPKLSEEAMVAPTMRRTDGL